MKTHVLVFLSMVLGLWACDTAPTTNTPEVSWEPKWVALGEMPAGAVRVDSLGRQLAILADSTGVPVLWISPDGAGWSRGASVAWTAKDTITFWGGKAWWVRHDSVGELGYQHSCEFVKLVGSVCKTSVFPHVTSAVVHSFDGKREDSTLLNLPAADSTIGLALVPGGERMALLELRGETRWQSLQPSFRRIAGRGWYTSGAGWTADEDSGTAWWYRAALLASYGDVRRVDGAMPPALLLDWFPMLPQSLVKPAVVDSNSFAALIGAGQSYNWLMVPRYGIAGHGGSFFALTNGAVWRIPVSGTANAQVASPSSNLTMLQVWRGKLLVSDGATLWSASLEGAP